MPPINKQTSPTSLCRVILLKNAIKHPSEDEKTQRCIAHAEKKITNQASSGSNVTNPPLAGIEIIKPQTPPPLNENPACAPQALAAILDPAPLEPNLVIYESLLKIAQILQKNDASNFAIYKSYFKRIFTNQENIWRNIALFLCEIEELVTFTQKSTGCWSFFSKCKPSNTIKPAEIPKSSTDQFIETLSSINCLNPVETAQKLQNTLDDLMNNKAQFCEPQDVKLQ